MDTAGTAAESTDPFSSSVKLPIVPSCRRSERYCDVAFLSDRLLYDITSQEILKYFVTSSSNNNGSSLSSSANQILRSPDYDEDGLSAYRNVIWRYS
jgi:RNase P/RNase MRP subunit POP5